MKTDTRFVELPTAADRTRERRERKKQETGGKIAAVALAAYLLGGGMGLETGFQAARNSAEAKSAAEQMVIERGRRENAEHLASQYRKQYSDSVLEIAELKEQNAALTTENSFLAVRLEAPDPDTYASEFGWDFDLVVRKLGAECRGEPFEGMLAVAQCIADAAEITGMTPEEVVKDPGYGYAEPVGHEVLAWMDAVNEAALQVFGQGIRVTDEPIEFFYSTKNGGYSRWHEESLRFVMQIGDHRFFARA